MKKWDPFTYIPKISERPKISENALTVGQWMHAVWMWSTGRDTLDIAQYFRMKEAFIYVYLPKWRRRCPGIGEIASTRLG